MEWIPIHKELPKENSRVEYRMIKKERVFKRTYVTDVGFYSKGDFITIDPKYILPISHWRYLNFENYK